MNKSLFRLSSSFLVLMMAVSPVTIYAEDTEPSQDEPQKTAQAETQADSETEKVNATAESNESVKVTASAQDAMNSVIGRPGVTGISRAVQNVIKDKVPDITAEVKGNTAFTDLDLGTPDQNLDLKDDNYQTGWSYYNVMILSTKVKQLKSVLDANPSVTQVTYSNGKTVSTSYIDDLDELLNRLNSFDHSLSLKYDFSREGANYIAENKTARLEFHVQTNGYWGYDLAGDSIIDKVTDQKGGYQENQNLNDQYAQFFKVDMTEKYPGMYVLNDTDLQNPVLIMNDKEAIVIDADFRGGENFHKLIKDTIGNRDLYFYITHSHGDHYLNLKYFDTNEIKGIYYGKDDPIHGKALGGTYDEIFQRFIDADKMIFYKDGDTFTRAGKNFEVIEMNNHTPGGSQLLDVTDRVLFSGDTIGAQTFKGGTTVALSAVDNWIDQISHSVDVLKLGTKDQRIDHIIGGHTNYLNTPDFELWVRQALQEVQKNGVKALTANPIGQNTVVVRDGKVLSSAENLSLFVNGTPEAAVSDEDVTHMASINVRDDSQKEEEKPAENDHKDSPESIKDQTDQKESETKQNNTGKTTDQKKTGRSDNRQIRKSPDTSDNFNAGLFTKLLIGASALAAGAWITLRKNR